MLGQSTSEWQSDFVKLFPIPLTSKLQVEFSIQGHLLRTNKGSNWLNDVVEHLEPKTQILNLECR